MIKHISLLVFATLTGLLSYGQIKSEFNLPPNTSISPKFYQKIDYSFKLNDKSLNEPIKKEYLFKFSKNELEKTKTKNPETYIYYITADKYFKNLSDFVKSKFTAKELWYIYKCDQKLKNKLLTIK
jgi:hypothetical protein